MSQGKSDRELAAEAAERNRAAGKMVVCEACYRTGVKLTNKYDSILCEDSRDCIAHWE